MADQFPPEIIYDILSRMPIKSLARFRCVCKLWLKYINDPYLETIHVEEEPTPIMFQRFQPRYPYPPRLCKITFLRVAKGASAAKQEPVMKMWYRSLYLFTNGNVVLGSCNGLTLVYYEQDTCHDILFAVTNPLTKQYYHLPPAKPGPWHYSISPAAGIGYDESTDTLKTMCVIFKKHNTRDINVIRQQQLTLVYKSGMRSWRGIAQKPPYPIRGEGVYAHGRLYWLASLDAYCWPPNYDGRKIVWFDVKLEEFGLLDPPKLNFTRDYFLRDHYRKHDHVVGLNGEVGYALVNHFFMELWIFKQEEWVLHCCFETVGKRYLKHVVILGCLNKNGDILLTSRGGRCLFVYTLSTGDLRQVNRGDLRQINPDVASPAEIRMYQSSLFSIRGVNASTYCESCSDINSKG